MEGGYYYNFEEGTSYPQGYNPHMGQGHLLANRPTSINPLYGPVISSLGKQSEYNMDRLKQKLSKGDPCYEFGVEHWHSGDRREQGKNMQCFTFISWLHLTVMLTNIY